MRSRSPTGPRPNVSRGGPELGDYLPSGSAVYCELDIDDGSLPEAVVLDYVLAETLDGLTTHAGHDAAVDLLDRLEENARFHVESTTASARATAKALFRRHRPLSFVDACIVSYMQTEELGYLYAFDDDFDALDDVYRLETATDPFEP